MIKLKNIMESAVSENDDEFDIKRGVAMAKKDYMAGYERDLDPDYLSPAFLKGYKIGLKAIKKQRGDTWWNRFNDRLTDFLARMGSSRLR